MTTHTALCGAIESALNFYLRQDPQALDQCSTLEGKIIAIDFMVPGLLFYFLPHASGVQVLSQYEGQVDTRLTGSPLGFARLTLVNKENALFTGAVHIEGDTETGQKFQELLAGTDWDWEEQLSRLTGDVIAHQIGKLSRQAQRLASDNRRTLERDISEYLHEEARLLPARDEVEFFLEQVDLLRSATDRLNARMQRLLQSGDPGA
jgi:ubiquinone biosynthesis protein UbiJ